MKFTNEHVRRQDRTLNETRAFEILKEGEYGILSMQSENGDGAYGIPLSYVWDRGNSIYIHCAPVGRKLNCIDRCNRVSFCVIGRTKVLPEQFTTAYESVVVQGEAYHSLPDAERMSALSLFISKYCPEHKIKGMTYAEKSFFRTEIIPAAFNCGRIINDPGFAACKRRICGLMQQPDCEENARADQQDEENDRIDGNVLRACFTRGVNVFFFGFHRENSFCSLVPSGRHPQTAQQRFQCGRCKEHEIGHRQNAAGLQVPLDDPRDNADGNAVFFIQPCDRKADVILFSGHSGIVAGVRDGVDAVVQADIHNTAAKICYLAGVLALYLTLLQIVHAGFGKRAADICPDGKMLGILTADLLHANQNTVADAVILAGVTEPCGR